VADVRVDWTTDELADSQVEYGTTTSYGTTTTLDPTLQTSHSVTVTGLTAGTLYHFRAKSRDAAGNLATSSDTTATTTAADTTAPTISSLTASGVTGSAATITWTTDEAASSRVEYRIQGQSTWLQSALDSAMVTSHSVALAGLTGNRTYEYRAISADAAGNSTTSATQTFATPLSGASPLFDSNTTYVSSPTYVLQYTVDVASLPASWSGLRITWLPNDGPQDGIGYIMNQQSKCNTMAGTTLSVVATTGPNSAGVSANGVNASWESDATPTGTWGGREITKAAVGACTSVLVTLRTSATVPSPGVRARLIVDVF
jgi:hypothetical protein